MRDRLAKAKDIVRHAEGDVGISRSVALRLDELKMELDAASLAFEQMRRSLAGANKKINELADKLSRSEDHIEAVEAESGYRCKTCEG